MIERIKSFLLQCSRVWILLKKPSYEEIKTITKVSAIGLFIIGLIGFLMSIVMTAFG